MTVDYIMICKCGWERYSASITEAKSNSKAHVKTCDSPEVYIDQSIDNELNDHWKSIIIR